MARGGEATGGLVRQEPGEMVQTLIHGEERPVGGVAPQSVGGGVDVDDQAAIVADAAKAVALAGGDQRARAGADPPDAVADFQVERALHRQDDLVMRMAVRTALAAVAAER